MGHRLRHARPTRNLARAITVLSLVAGGLALVSFPLTDTVKVYVADGVAQADLEPHGLTLAAVAFWLANHVTMLVWTHRSTANAWDRPGPGKPPSPGWAVGSWFVPFVGPLLGTLAIEKTWRRTTPRSAKLVWAWFGLLVAGFVVAAIGIRHAEESALDSIGAEGASVQGSPMHLAVDTTAKAGLAVGGLLLAGAAVLFVLIVQEITRRQARWLEPSRAPQAPAS